MNRAEFMSRLTTLLQDVPLAEREEAIQYYNDYFDDAGEENEAGVITALGSPEELAKSIKAGLADGGSGGEFTESGFHSYEQRNENQIMSTDQGRKDGRGNGLGQNSAQTGEQGFQGGARTDGQGFQGGARTDGQNFQGRPYWQQGSAYGQQENAGDGAYWQQGGAYGQQQYTGGGRQNGAGRQPAKSLTGGKIALIILLAVLLSPVWIGVLGGLFGGGVGLLAGLFGIFVAFLVVGVVLTVVGIALVVTGIVAIFSAPLGGLCLVGGGLIMVAFGLVFIWLMVLVVGTAIPALVRGIVSLCNKIFHRGGARA